MRLVIFFKPEPRVSWITKTVLLDADILTIVIVLELENEDSEDYKSLRPRMEKKS